MNTHPHSTEKITFYDRATNMDIFAETDPTKCIEPIAIYSITNRKGQKSAKALPMRTKGVTRAYKRSFLDKLLQRPALTYTRIEFDLNRTVKELMS